MDGNVGLSVQQFGLKLINNYWDYCLEILSRQLLLREEEAFSTSATVKLIFGTDIYVHLRINFNTLVLVNPELFSCTLCLVQSCHMC